MSVWAAAEREDFDGIVNAVQSGADIEERGGCIEGTAFHFHPTTMDKP